MTGPLPVLTPSLRLTRKFSGRLDEVINVAQEDIDALNDLARCVNYEIMLRAKLLANVAKQRRLDLTIEASGDGIWDWNITTGELFCSDRLLQIVGIEPAGFHADFDSFLDRLDPAHRERVSRAFKEHLSDGVSFDTRFRLKHSKGHWVEVSAKGQAAWDDAGEPIRMVGTVSDISELVKSNDL